MNKQALLKKLSAAKKSKQQPELSTQFQKKRSKKDSESDDQYSSSGDESSDQESIISANKKHLTSNSSAVRGVKRDLASSSVTSSTSSTTAPKKLKTSFAWNIDHQKENGNSEQQDDDESASEDDDEEQVENDIDERAKTHHHHHDVHHLTETEIAEIEESLPNKAPTSEADFERLVIGEPNNSYLWIQYMTFMLNTYGFEKAKEIGERAVNRIHFSYENERFNLWSAILSLYVSNNKPNIEKVIEKALQGSSKPQSIYLQYATILNKLYEKKKQRLDEADEEAAEESDADDENEVKKKKTSELEDLLNRIDQVYRKACKKYRNEKKVFEEYERWCISTLKDIKKGELVLERSLKVFPNKEHISLRCKFAILLYKTGENILDARNVMENIIQNHPKRSDAWSIYLDCEQQHTKDVRYIREIFERVCHLTTLSTKKMKSFLQRYLKFETQYGDADRQEHVKKIAKDFIQSKLQKAQTVDANN
ncbi:hypothetical protein C9374_000512 [Naegleria lovaniensis]|uniref:Suppressor of forked domain-containing protein n=1 Tax=Naegleria lovaniensis TaxID=51637 RepID=A0AA88GZ77_NAELO|nr:uncharacterized protein C9374_000512 [Naegleria lovaniensis]KAG2388348.1 hypothetical protein C9374_000512 [Naegleria lovaniensis]